MQQLQLAMLLILSVDILTQTSLLEQLQNMKTTNGQVLTIFWNLAMDTLLSLEPLMKLWLSAVLESMLNFD